MIIPEKAKVIICIKIIKDAEKEFASSKSSSRTRCGIKDEREGINNCESNDLMNIMKKINGALLLSTNIYIKKIQTLIKKDEKSNTDFFLYLSIITPTNGPNNTIGSPTQNIKIDILAEDDPFSFMVITQSIRAINKKLSPNCSNPWVIKNLIKLLFLNILFIVY
jgi:hypothetical protein